MEVRHRSSGRTRRLWVFRHIQERLPNQLALEGVRDMGAANDDLRTFRLVLPTIPLRLLRADLHEQRHNTSFTCNHSHDAVCVL